MSKQIAIDEKVYEKLTRIKGELIKQQGKNIHYSDVIAFLIEQYNRAEATGRDINAVA